MEHRLQIEFIHSRNRWLPGFLQSKDIVQTKPFDIGFRLKNIGDSPIMGASITNILWKSADGKNVAWAAEKSFHLDSLNPDESKELWIVRAGTYVHGLCDISLSITSDATNETIKTFQIDPFTKVVSPCKGINSWMDFFFIRSKSEYEQTRINTFLLVFTIYLFIIGAYTLKLQLKQISDTDSRNKIQAEQYCKSSPTAQVPLSDGRMVDCSVAFPDIKKE